MFEISLVHLLHVYDNLASFLKQGPWLRRFVLEILHCEPASLLLPKIIGEYLDRL
jgi:hypothetical protein